MSKRIFFYPSVSQTITSGVILVGITMLRMLLDEEHIGVRWMGVLAAEFLVIASTTRGILWGNAFVGSTLGVSEYWGKILCEIPGALMAAT
jgi:hypothetical protein